MATEQSDVRLLAAGTAAARHGGAVLAPSRRRHLADVDGDRFATRVARSAEDVEALRGAWTSMPRDSVQTDIDYFLWSLEKEPQVVRPHVVVVERGGRVEAILAARLSDVRLPCRLGSSRLYAPRVRAICVLHDGLLGIVDPLTTDAVTDELLAGLERREAEVIVFRQLALDSALHRAASARATFATRQHGVRPDLRWEIELPATPDGYLASLSSSTRKAARRAAKRLEQRFGGRLAVRSFSAAEESEALFNDLEAVAAKTYQRRLGVGYLGDPQQRERLEMLLERGWLRASILYLDGTPVAFELGELYRGRFRSLAGGYDRAYGQHRVGAYLLVRTIEDFAADPDVSVFDFGLGDAEYKSRLAHRSAREADLLLYARRAKPILVNFARAALLALSSGANGLLRRVALLERIKRRRRSAKRRPAAD